MHSLLNTTVLNSIYLIQKNISRILPFFLLPWLMSPIQADTSSPLPVVVISQIVQHVSLDQEREGLIAALQEAGYEDGKTITLLYKNAQGSITTASQIASYFASQKPVVAVAISTPSAQTLIKPMVALQVPVVFTAVTDPLGAKLITTLDPRPEAVTGVSDALPVHSQLALIQKVLPTVKTIGIVYNAGETNSVESVRQLQEEAEKMGLTLVHSTASKSSDVIPAVEKLLKTVDAFYIPTDNTAVAAMESIVNLVKKFNKDQDVKRPVFAGDAGSVERGAIAAYAYDRKALGREAGNLVVRILKGQKAGDLPVATHHPLVLMVNLRSAEEMGITLPPDLVKEAKDLGEAA